MSPKKKIAKKNMGGMMSPKKKTAKMMGGGMMGMMGPKKKMAKGGNVQRPNRRVSLPKATPKTQQVPPTARRASKARAAAAAFKLARAKKPIGRLTVDNIKKAKVRKTGRQR